MDDFRRILPLKTPACSALLLACGLMLPGCLDPMDGGMGANRSSEGGSNSGPLNGTASAGTGASSGHAESVVGAANGGGAGASALGVSGAGGSLAVVVALDQPEQVMAGFGISDLFATPLTDLRAEVLFDPKSGIGLSILRIGMSSSGQPVSSIPKGAGDVAQWVSSGSSPLSDVMMAKNHGATTFIATVLSAPAACKTNGSELDGGHLNPDCYDSWSDTIAAFPALVKAGTGVDLFAMSVANEPDVASCDSGAPCYGSYPSMLYTADELVNFMGVVGPKLHAANPGIRLIAPEPSEWLRLWSDESAVGSLDPLLSAGYDYGHALFQNRSAWSQIDLIGTQQYDTQRAFPQPSDVPQSKPIWQTQMSGIEWWPEGGPSADITNGVAVAAWIHDAIVNGQASAWLWFRYEPLKLEDNEGLVLKDGTVTKRLFTLGNFSKFVRPGYTRVDVTGNGSSDLLLSAFVGEDGTVVVVAINRGGALTLPITLSGGVAPASVTPWVTSATQDLAAGTALPLNSGKFVASLGSQTVTTFVGN